MKLRLVFIAALVVSLGACSSLAPVSRDQMQLGVAAARRGYWQEALFRFERAREAAPDNAEVLNNVAVAEEALGRYDDALATYKDALRRAPHDTAIRRNYARFAEFYTSYARGVKPERSLDGNR